MAAEPREVIDIEQIDETRRMLPIIASDSGFGAFDQDICRTFNECDGQDKGGGRVEMRAPLGRHPVGDPIDELPRASRRSPEGIVREGDDLAPALEGGVEASERRRVLAQFLEGLRVGPAPGHLRGPGGRPGGALDGGAYNDIEE